MEIVKYMIRLLTKMTKRREHTKVGCSRHGKPQIDLGQESQGSQQGGSECWDPLEQARDRERTPEVNIVVDDEEE